MIRLFRVGRLAILIFIAVSALADDSGKQVYSEDLEQKIKTYTYSDRELYPDVREEAKRSIQAIKFK